MSEPTTPRTLDLPGDALRSSHCFVGRRILLLIVGHLASAPRAQKEAAALRAAGAEVLIRGNWHDAALAEEDALLSSELQVDFAPAVDLRRARVGRPVRRLLDRMRHRLAREGFQQFGLMSPRAHGPGAPEQLRAARRIAADLTIVHSEPGLWVGRQLLAEGRRVGVDFEDWFSRDQLPQDRVPHARDALQSLERQMLRHAHCCTATTQVMAEALALDAATTRVPAVVPNCFPTFVDHATVRTPDPRPADVVSFYWVSQTIGPGRGLETLAQALPLLRGAWQLSLRGALHGYHEWYARTFPETIRDRILCLPPVSNAELAACARAHDVGLALEMPYCANKQLTASNKLFEYLRAGLAVVATRTLGQQEIMTACPGAGRLVAPGDAGELAVAMQALIDDPLLLARTRAHAARAGREVWNWERYVPALLSSVADGLQLPAP